MIASPKKIAATVAAALDAPVLPEGCQVIQRKGWFQLMTPSMKDASANEIMLSQLESELERTVEDTIKMYQDLALPFKWAIGPMSSPTDLERLVARQASTSWEFKGMCIDTSVSIRTSSAVTIERVTLENFDDFLAVNVSGWELNNFIDQTVQRLRKMVLHPQYRCYLARQGGQAIGSAASLFKNDCACLLSAVVLKEFRGLGAYRELIRSRLIDMNQMGFSFAVTQARSATSAPILEKLNFETVYEARIYRFDWS